MQLFDETLRALRRRRAETLGPELFLYERAFEDLMERLSLVQRCFQRILLIGTLDPTWRDRLASRSAAVDVIDAAALLTVEPGTYDLCLAVEGLDTLNDLPQALIAVRFALKPDSLFLGSLPGGDTLPALRTALRAADEQMGAATPHVHPRIEPAGLAGLLSDAGFAMPVVDVDRVDVSYRALDALVRDLRAMGTTNQLHARSRAAFTRSAAAAAAKAFEAQAVDGRVRERFELLHFAAWTPSHAQG